MMNQPTNNAFDLTNVLAQAAQVTKNSEDSERSGMKLVYPQNGVMKVRLLYNNKSQTVMRKFERHTVNNTKVTCLTNYGQECPICKTLDNISNVKGTDLWKLKRTTRGIAYAEYIESDYKWENPQNAPAKGEIVILMFPWTLYTDFNRLISSAGNQIYSLICSNIGGVFKISRWVEKGQTKYRGEIDPFDNQHRTCASDEEYNKLIMDLPSLNEKFVPVEINDNIVKAAKTMADQLNKEYLSPQVVQPNVGQAGMNLGGFMGNTMAPQMPQMMPQSPVAPAPVAPPVPPQVPQLYTDPTTGAVYEMQNGQWVLKTPPQPVVPPTPPAAPAQAYPQTAPQAPSNNPPCYGKFGSTEVNPNNCLMCPNEITCRTASGK